MRVYPRICKPADRGSAVCITATPTYEAKRKALPKPALGAMLPTINRQLLKSVAALGSALPSLPEAFQVGGN